LPLSKVIFDKIALNRDIDKVMTEVDFSKFFLFFNKFKSIETFIPVAFDLSNKYIICISGGERNEEASFRRVKIMVIVYTALFALVVLVFGYIILSRKVINPLEKISKGAFEIAGGRLNTDISVNLPNEIGELANSLQKMTEKLIANQNELSAKLYEVNNLNRALHEAQMEIVRTEKLASIGRLSSGIAHEIGNPLSAVLGYVEILKKKIKEKDDNDLLIRSGEEIQRISKIIRELLDFSRPIIPDIKEIDLKESLSGAIENLRDVGALKNIRVSLEPSGDIAKVLIDEGQFRQVMVNILKNSTDAVFEKYRGNVGGEIFINISISSLKELDELRSVFMRNLDKRRDDPPDKLFLGERLTQRKSDPPDAKLFKKRGKTKFGYPKFLFDEEEKFIKLTVEDNGAGIKREDLQKIFDPFYTTKEPGKGTGLGLYMTLNIVDAMGGYIDVISEHGKGTLFLVLLHQVC